MNAHRSLLHAAPADRARLARLALVDAATTLLEQMPADQIAIAELTRTAGVSRPTFYRHFDSSVALVRAAVLTKLQASFDAAPPPEAQDDWVPSAQENIHQLLTELHDHAQLYLNAVHGSNGLQLMGDAIDFLSRRILEDSPLAPQLRASNDEITADDHATFLSAGIAWYLLQWLHTDRTGPNSIDRVAHRIVAHLIVVMRSGTR